MGRAQTYVKLCMPSLTGWVWARPRNTRKPCRVWAKPKTMCCKTKCVLPQQAMSKTTWGMGDAQNRCLKPQHMKLSASQKVLLTYLFAVMHDFGYGQSPNICELLHAIVDRLGRSKDLQISDAIRWPPRKSQATWRATRNETI